MKPLIPLAACVLGLVSLPLRAQEGRAIEVDLSKAVGTIKPLNGVNGGPIVTRGAFDLTPNFKELGISHIRLHDVPWTYEDAVDVNCVFPFPDADPEKAKNYTFETTDHYMKSVMALGVDVTYRIGYSAEWEFHPPTHNAPPKDFKKWAAVGAQIVQHYNKGWANGFKYNIKTWEIGNEPDIKPFWTGTPEQFYQLYELTAKAVKKADPTVKVGGPGLAANLPFLDGLLKHCAATKTPMDFASWHIYTTLPTAVAAKAAQVQALLDKHGFKDADNVLNEWNYYPSDWVKEYKDVEYRRDMFANKMGGPVGAAFDAAVLIYLQDSSVDTCDFYQGTTMFWGGMYDEFAVPRKPYYTFKAFKQLLDTPERVAATGSDEKGFAVLAGRTKDKAQAGVLIGNFGTENRSCTVTFKGLLPGKSYDCEWSVVDGTRNLEQVKSEKVSGALSIEIEANSVCLLRLKAE